MMISLAQQMGWGCLIVGISLAKITMATTANCMGKIIKGIAVFRYRGSIDIF
jgi:hypothetical protein